MIIITAVFFLSVTLIFTLITYFGGLLFGVSGGVSIFRIVNAAVSSVTFSYWGYKRRSLSISGALLAVFVGAPNFFIDLFSLLVAVLFTSTTGTLCFVLTMCSYAFCVALLTFFVTSSRLTKVRESTKNVIDPCNKPGGQRDWVQVLCNGGVAAEVALLYLMEIGPGEFPLDLTYYFSSTMLSLSVVAAISCSCGDTWASEIGSVFGGIPRLITCGRKVPAGTNGGVTLLGLLVSFLGGIVVGVSYYLTMSLLADGNYDIVIFAGISGLYGSVVDSLLGEKLQYSGWDNVNEAVVHAPGAHVQLISGIHLLDNHSVNLLSSLISAVTMPAVYYYMLASYQIT